jgi:hypothetical protein
LAQFFVEQATDAKDNGREVGEMDVVPVGFEVILFVGVEYEVEFLVNGVWCFGI